MSIKFHFSIPADKVADLLKSLEDHPELELVFPEALRIHAILDCSLEAVESSNKC